MAPMRDNTPEGQDFAHQLRTRLGRTPLVGREAELTMLASEQAEVISGEPRAVMIAGDAGIGKTRLLRAACESMTASGGIVLLGRCVDEQGMPPFFPWITALNGQAAARRDLAPLRALLSGTDRHSDHDVEWQTPEQRKLRVFAGVGGELGRLSQKQPVMLAFDDLQWSDVASNELLRYVLTHAEHVRLLVLGTLRSDEASTNDALQRTRDELHRQRLLTTVRVGPLSVAATEQHVELLTGRSDQALAHAIHDHCDGNPFFAEEVLRQLVEDGRLDARPTVESESIRQSLRLPVPHSVVTVIERRLERASDTCRTILEQAALMGTRFSVELLARTSGYDASTIAVYLEEATGLALVQPSTIAGTSTTGPAVGEADYAFLHDRIRESIEGTINPVHRRELHERIAIALEASYPASDDLARLAAVTHHFRMAHQNHRAATAAERLGDTAMRAHAHSNAADAFRLALELAAGDTTPPDAQRAQASLRIKRGDSLLATGNPEGAVANFAHAERTFVDLHEPWQRARCLRRLGMAHARQEHLVAAIEQYGSAIRTLEEMTINTSGSDPDEEIATELALCLVELGEIEGTSLAWYDHGINHGRSGLALATDHAPADRSLEPYARLSLAKTLIRAGSLDEGHVVLAPALPLALQRGDHHLAAEIAGALANYHFWTGELMASAQYAHQRQELAHDIHDPFLLRHINVWHANLAQVRGDWPEANRLLDEAELQVARIESPEPRAFIKMIRGLVKYQQGRYQESIALFEAAIAGFRTSGPATVSWYIGCLAQAYLDAGNHELMRLTVEEMNEIIASFPTTSLPRSATLSQVGIIAARTHDMDAATDIFEKLQEFHGQFHWVAIDRVLGMLATTLGDLSAAERFFTAAASMASRDAILPELALILAEHGTALTQSNDPDTRDRGVTLLKDGISRLDHLGMAGASARYTSALAEPAPTSNAAAPAPAGLTQREVDVLVLLTQGLTNRQIGESLSISEKTVTNHLTHIFTKANLDNRSAAVAFAIRHGLAR